MDISKLIRNADKVHAALKEMPNGNLVAVKECKIYIPLRFTECGLAFVGVETLIVGIYAIVVDNVFYAVSNICALLNITPTSTVTVTIDDEEYYEFTFEAGSIITPNVNLVKTDTLAYRIYDEILSKAKVPWYMNYNDLGSIFDTALHHAGANVGKNQEVTELIVSMLARNKKDRHVYYRSTIKTQADLENTKPVFTPLRSVQYAATNTTNKLAGSYFGVGVNSALVTPASRVEHIESLLTK